MYRPSGDGRGFTPFAIGVDTFVRVLKRTIHGSPLRSYRVTRRSRESLAHSICPKSRNASLACCSTISGVTGTDGRAPAFLGFNQNASKKRVRQRLYTSLKPVATR